MSAKFWDKIAKKYAAQPIGNMKAYEQGLAIIAQYLAPDKDVLELGAGTSSTAMRLAPLARSYVSTDISKNMVEIGRQKAANVANLDVHVYDLMAEDWQGRADIVLGLNFLHLVRDVPLGLSRIAKVLPEGGVFISKSACISGKYKLVLPIIFVLRMIGKAPKVTTFSQQDLTSMIENAGFEIETVMAIPEKSMSRFIVARKL